MPDHGSAVWDYSLNQLLAFRFLKEKRERREAAKSVTMMANATQGDGKTIKKLLKELTRE